MTTGTLAFALACCSGVASSQALLTAARRWGKTVSPNRRGWERAASGSCASARDLEMMARKRSPRVGPSPLAQEGSAEGSAEGARCDVSVEEEEEEGEEEEAKVDAASARPTAAESARRTILSLCKTCAGRKLRARKCDTRDREKKKLTSGDGSEGSCEEWGGWGEEE